MKSKLSLAIILFAAVTVNATPEIFFGQDVSTNPIGGGQVPRPTNITNTLATQASFLASLSGIQTESFESFPTDSNPTDLLFGTNTATMSGNRTVLSITYPTQTLDGGFPLTGTNFVALSGGSDQSFTITFSTPQTAFGFFGSDIELNALQLTFTSTNGTQEILSVPVVVPQGSAGSYYYGLIDQAAPFVSVKFKDVGTNQDGFAFDDMSIGAPIGTSDGLLPPTLYIQTFIQLHWDTVSNEIYQLQDRNSLTNNNWLPFGSPVIGTGATYYTNYPVVPPADFFRLFITNSL
jgi:hypothetical protein